MASSSSCSSATDDDRRPKGGGGAPPRTADAGWAASYYGGQPPYAAWPATQHLMAGAAAAAFGPPVPFPMYHHPACYAQPTMAAGVPYMAGETAPAVAEGKSKRRIRRSPSGGDASESGSSDGASQASPEKTDVGADHKGSSWAKRRRSAAANDEGEPSQVAAATTQNAATGPPLVAKGWSASKLSVTAPGRTAIPNATPNLNIGMALWSTSSSTVVPSGQGEVNAEDSSQSNISLSQMDERELRRERRKQSNRESARRSRLRKQKECDELAQKVNDLTAMNGALRSELDQLKKQCKDTEAENTQLMDEILTPDDEMLQSESPSVVTTLSIQVDGSRAHHGKNGKAS